MRIVRKSFSVATVAQQLGLTVPIVGNNPTFAPAILTKETEAALANYLLVASAAPYASEVPKAVEVGKAYKALGKDEAPNAGVPYGYAIGEIWGQLLETACENHDLTRQGIQDALKESANVDTGDLVAALDFSSQGTPATREVYVGKPDLSLPGGLLQVGPLFTSADAKSYVAPEQK